MTGNGEIGVLLAGFSGLGTQDHQTAMYLPALDEHPGFRILAVCPSGPADAGRARCAAERLGVPCLPDVTAGLRVPGVRAASVAFPPDARAEAIAAALREGKHVLADKPLAPTLREVGNVIRLASDGALVLLAAHHQRWNPSVLAARAALAGGQVGLPWNVQADFLVAGGAHVQAGELLNLAVYPVDIARFLLGLPAARVYARAGSYWHEGPGADFVALFVEYGSNVTAAITVGRMAETAGVPPGGLARHRYRISGTHGVLSVDARKPGLSVRTAAGATSPWTGTGTVRALADEFHRAIASGQPASVSPGDVLDAHRVLAAAEASLRTGCACAVPADTVSATDE